MNPTMRGPTLRTKALLVAAATGLVLLTVAAVLNGQMNWRPWSPRAAMYPSAGTCAACHPKAVAQWKASPHARAAESPMVDADVCTGCHAPVAALFGASVNPLSSLPPSLPMSAFEGVTCVVCHAGPHSGGEHVLRIRPMGENTVESLFDIPGFETAIGPFGSGRSGDPPPVMNETHDSSVGAGLARPDFCRPCHDIVMDKTLAGRRTDRTEAITHISETHDEWAASPYALSGETCQSCHMPISPDSAPAAVQPADVTYDRPLPLRQLSDHSSPGVDIAIWDEGPHVERQRERVAELLATAAEVDITAPDTVTPGSFITITVEVANVGAGHDLPTGLPFAHDAWLEVVVADANGREMFASGHSDAGGWVYDELNPHVQRNVDLYDLYLLSLRNRMVRAEEGIDAWLQADGSVALPPRGVDRLRNLNGTPVLGTRDYDASPILARLRSEDDAGTEPDVRLQEVFMMYLADVVLKNGIPALESRTGEYTFRVDDDAVTPLTMTVRLLMRQMHPYALAVEQGQPHLVPRMPIYELDADEVVMSIRP